jgi:hypothetical protein
VPRATHNAGTLRYPTAGIPILIRSDVTFPLRSPFLHFPDVLGVPFVYLILYAFEEFGGFGTLTRCARSV